MKYAHTKKQWIKWYEQKRKLMGEAYTEVTPLEFYKDMFDGYIQSKGQKETNKGNAMVDIVVHYENRTEIGEKNERAYSRKYIMTDDYEALKYMKPIKQSREESRLCLCSPCTYFGKHKSNNMAHEIVGVALDLDYVGVQQLKNVIKQVGNGSRIMPPNYIVNSGRGLHLYYLLEKPIPCYKYMVEQLTKFKAVLQDFIWNETSSLKPEKPDHGAITQAFRMVGSETKLGKDYIVRAYKVREERWTIETLYYWVEKKAQSFLKDCPLPELREPIDVYRQRHPLTMAEAKKKYPDWNPYAASSKKWTCKPDLYEWWIRQIKDKAIVGGRYYAVLALAAYGSKCDIPLKQIEEDAMKLVPILEELTDDETNHFTKADVKDALSFFKNNRKEVTYKLTRDRISELSKIDIQSNKRNGRKLKTTHQQYRRGIKALKIQLGESDNWDKGGRPDKQQLVKEWRKANPDGTKAECNRATGLDPKTIRKWW